MRTEAHERRREYLVLVSRERWARGLVAMRESIGTIMPIDFDGGDQRGRAISFIRSLLVHGPACVARSTNDAVPRPEC